MLKILQRIVQKVNEIPVLDDALAFLAVRLTEAMNVDSCSIYLADYDQQHMLLKATQGLSQDAVGKVAVGFSEGLIGLIGQREEPLNIVDARSHPRFKHFPEVKEEKYHAFLGAPIIHQRKVLGVVTLQQQGQRKFSEDEEAFLSTLCAQLALEIKHAEIRGLLHMTASDTADKKQTSCFGVPGAPGLASGLGYVAEHCAKVREHIGQRASDTERQIDIYRNAVTITRDQVEDLSERVGAEVPDDVKSIFQIYHQLLDANSLGHEVEAHIHQGWDAASSLKIVVESYIQQFSEFSDPYMRERAIDVEDLANRVFVNILGIQNNHHQQVPDESFILVAEEISAPMLAEMPRETLRGIVSMKGSSNSHAAILARAMGLPAVMGLTDVPLSWLDKRKILLDGYSGEVIVAPSVSVAREFNLLVHEEQLLSDRISAQANMPSVTSDGCEMALYINVGLSAELESDSLQHGEGIGLYRTEVPFMLRERFPSEHEQMQMYQQILQSNPQKSITMRTLDVGGDKPLPYFPIQEENPFLGWRGIRLTLDHPEIFLVQVRAMLRASVGFENLQIMLPMITSISEVKESKRLIKQAFHEISEELADDARQFSMPKIGVMLEVPAVLYQLPQLASQVDFFSVGSNDLTQYLLAVDRNNARVASLYDSYHPAVLSALLNIVEQSNRFNVPVTVCGELAGDPGGAILLMAMGYRKLSMSSHNLLKVKWLVRSVSLQQAQELLQRAIKMKNPQDVRDEVNLFMEYQGLGGLVRAGF